MEKSGACLPQHVWKYIYYISLLQWNIEHTHEQLVMAQNTEND